MRIFLLHFFCLLLLPFSSNGQSWTIQDCLPTTLGTNLYGPMYSVATANATSRTAVIYQASLLTTLNGGTLSNLYLKRLTASGAMAGTPNYKVYLKEVTNTDWGASALDWATATTGATLVYDGNPASIVGSAAGWVNFPFSSTFLYNGGNLALFTEYTNATASTAITFFYEYTNPCISTTNNNTTKYSNVTTGVLPTSLASTNYRRPLIGFDYTLPGCTNPVTGGTTNASITIACPGSSVSFTISGASSGSGITHNWQSSPVGASTFTDIPGATSASLARTITTSAEYRRGTTCLGGTTEFSTPITVSMTQAALPYSQSFGTYPAAAGTQVDCWSEAAGPSAGPFTSTTISNWLADGFANSGTTGAARCLISGTGTDEWLLSPSFSLTGGQQVEFDIALTGSGVTTASTLGSDDVINFLISTDNGATWSTTLQSWNSTSTITNLPAGDHIVINLSAYSGDVRFAFYCESTVTNAASDFFVDNFLVQDVPSCFQPSGLSSTNLTTTTADLSWMAPATSPVQYEWKVVAAGAGSGAAAVASGIVTHPNVTATATGLIGSTAYDAWVRSACAGGNSIYVGPHAFLTAITNDEPSGAIPLTLATPQTIVTVGATQSLVACTGTADDDVWYSFTPVTSGTYQVAFASLAGTTDQGYEIFDGNPLTSGVSLSCHDGPAAGADFDGWQSGVVYYIRVYSWSSTSSLRITGGTITINNSAAMSPSNNWCDAPVAITPSVNGSCSYTSLTSVAATYSLRATCITSVSSPANEDDIWVSFTTTFAGAYNFRTTTTGTFGIALYTGGCTNTTQVGCNISFTGTTGYSAVLLGNTTYLARVWGTATTGGVAFDLCIEAPEANTEFTGTGNWSNPANWSNGVPDCSSNPVDALIAPGAVCNLDASGSAKKVTVAGTLNINTASTLTVGCTNANNDFLLGPNSTLNVSAGTLMINGRFASTSSSGTLIQSGGEIIVDGNDGNLTTSASNHIFDMIVTAPANLQLTGGSITIVDPCASISTSAVAFKLYPSVPVAVGANHTLKIGTGAGSDGGTNGYYINLAGASTANTVSMGKVEVNTGTGINRHILTVNIFGVLDEFKVISGDFRSSSLYCAKDVIVQSGGTLTATSTFYMGTYAGAAGPTTNAQTISGAGTFRNNATTTTANATAFTVNNTGAGVTIALDPFQISSTLTLTAGKVFMKMDGSGTFIHGATSQPTLSGTYNATTTSYIVGKLRRYISTTVNSDRYFPIGTPTENRLVTLNPAVVTTAGFVEASFKVSDPGTAGAGFTSQGITIENVAPTGYWDVTATTFASTNYSLKCNATGFTKRGGTNPVTDFANVRLIKRASGSNTWGTFTSTTTSGPSDLANLSAAGLSGFSEFALGGTNGAIQDASVLSLTNTFIEGYMNGATMRPVLANAAAAAVGSGGTMPPTFTPPATGTACDLITVELHAATSPYAMVHTATAVLTTAGNATVTFPSAASGNSFYVVIKGRNLVETWSAAPVAFTATASQSFATAFSGNLGTVGGVPVIYSGDIAAPQDGNVDFFDYPIWESDYNNFAGGYYPADLNGDGNVDFFDYPIWESNYNNFIGVVKP
jgi:hypothetical protein